MKTKYYFVFCLSLLLMACSKRAKNEPDNSSKVSPVVAVNINSDTHDADILLLCDDGSYMLCDMNKDDKCGMIYINESLDNELEDGITIYVDPTGIPTMLESPEGTAFFKNVTETTCDIAYRDNDGNITYFWDVCWNDGQNRNVALRRTPSSWESAITQPFKNWWSSVSGFDWSWDEHQRKAIIPALCKISSFAITAAGIVYGTPMDKISGIKTFIDEVNKSQLLDENAIIYSETLVDAMDIISRLDNIYSGWKYLKTKELKFANKLLLAQLANMLNEMGDEGLANLASFTETTQDIYENREYQLRLSTYTLECEPEEKSYEIDVNTLSYWTVDAPQNDWCTVSKENDHIVVHVTAYEEIEDRVCFAVIRTISDKIPTATLTIKQTGVVFTLSETDLTFVGKKASKGVLVTTNKNVRSWSVVSMPAWLTKDVANISFFLTVDPNQHDGTKKTGIVTVEAYMQNAANPLTRTINVTWIPQQEWDGTKWHFTGNVTVESTTSGIPTMTSPTDFILTVNSVANNDFSWTSGPQTFGGNISLNYADQLYIETPFSYSDPTWGTFSLKITLTISRRGETTALCHWKGSGQGSVQYGTLEGILIE